MKHEFTVVYEMGDDGWWVVSALEYPGALSQGKTIDEARENIIDALKELMLANSETAEESIPKQKDVVREVVAFEM